MIIATSEGMAGQIARRLGMPGPENIIRIEDVATPEEIRRARLERKTKGQHVIPVSQVQVRKNFAGKLVGKDGGAAGCIGCHGDPFEPHIVEKCLNHSMQGVMATYNRHEYAAERIEAAERWALTVQEIVTHG